VQRQDDADALTLSAGKFVRDAVERLGANAAVVIRILAII
jgi:hypothetical protein